MAHIKKVWIAVAFMTAILISSDCFFTLAEVNGAVDKDSIGFETDKINAKGMSIIEYIGYIVDAIGEKPVRENAEVRRLSGQFDITVTEAGMLCRAVKLGLCKRTTFKNVRKAISVQAAAMLAARADSLIYENKEEQITEEQLELVMTKRISDIAKVRKAWQRDFARAYALGLICGKSNGLYSSSRSFSPRTKCKRADCISLVSRLLNPERRYSLSPDMQMLRISDEDMPKLAFCYSYILDSFPNSYYDSMFNFMIHQVLPGNSVNDELWKSNIFELYCGRMTWDTVFSRMSFDDRYRCIADYDANSPLASNCAFSYPSEYDELGQRMRDEEGYWGMAANDEQKEAMRSGAAEYVIHALNVDYRTVLDDIEWQKYMLRNGVNSNTLSEYLRECVEDRLIIECDEVSCDISGIYYDHTPFVYKNCGGVVRVRAHFRIVSDSGEAFSDGALALSETETRQCLRKTEISEDGMSYIAVEDSEWQDGYFDIGTDTSGNVIAAVFDNIRYRGSFIKLFGYPCEAECYYPGTLTIDGIMKLRGGRMSKSEYLNTWGYLY